ncbi:MAG: hypothetical protein ACRDO1_04395 [Nocardioidaceae bacterium]
MSVPAGHNFTLRTDILNAESGPKLSVRRVKSLIYAELADQLRVSD